MGLVAAARRLAREAHGGQTDKLGRDYAEAHLAPIAAGCAVFGPDAEAAGWLHDIIEDTDHTVESLREAGVPDHIISAVESVTKRDGEPYLDLIARSCVDPLGRLVKLVDNAWNIACNPQIDDRELAARMLEQKYLPAREMLIKASGERDMLAVVVEQFTAQFAHLLRVP